MFEYRGKSLRIALLAALFGTLSATRAHADPNQCLHAPAAVPGLSGAPEWQDFNADGFWRPQLDDPRWAGGPLEYLSSPSEGGQAAWASQVAMRAVTVGRIVYVSIQALADDNGPSGEDQVYVAFTQGELAGAYALVINLASAGTSINPPANPAAGIVVPADNPLPLQLVPAAVAYYHADNARTDPSHPATEPVWGGENDGVPPWLKGARWDRPVLGGPRWAITLQIDLSLTGLNIAGPTNLFVGASVHTSTGDIVVGNATPKVGTDVDKLDVTPIPMRADLWPLYDEPGTACTNGIVVAPSDIGVWTGTPGVNGGGSLTNQICTGSGCPATENTFRVTVRHVRNTAGIEPRDVRVRLRFADWVSQSAYQQDAPWRDIAKTPTGSQLSLALPTADFTSANGWYYAPPLDEGDGTSTVTVDYKCTKGGDAFCPLLADPSAIHQAVSVELSVPSGFFSIATAAAYRTMEFTSSTSGPGSGGAPNGGTSGSPAGGGGSGAGGASAGGASAGGSPSSEAGTSAGGDAGSGEAGKANGGNSGGSGARGTPTAGASAGASTVQGAAGQGAAGAPTAPSTPDKGSSCGCRTVGRGSSGSASLAALLAMAVAWRRRLRKRAIRTGE